VFYTPQPSGRILTADPDDDRWDLGPTVLDVRDVCLQRSIVFALEIPLSAVLLDELADVELEHL